MDDVASGNNIFKGFSGILDCIKKVMREEGLSGFFKGFAMTALVGSVGVLAQNLIQNFGKSKAVEVKKLKPIEESINGNGFVEL